MRFDPIAEINRDTSRPSVRGIAIKPPARYNSAVSGFYNDLEAARHCPAVSRDDIVAERNAGLNHRS